MKLRDGKSGRKYRNIGLFLARYGKWKNDLESTKKQLVDGNYSVENKKSTPQQIAECLI